jgi:hypothetical protein
MRMNIQELEAKMRELSEKERDIDIRFRNATDPRDKPRFELEKGKVFKEIQEVQTQIKKLKDKNAENQNNELLNDGMPFIVVTVNGKRIQASEKIEITFEPCHHKLKIPLRDVIKNQNDSNITLLERWQRILSQGESYQPVFYCHECKREEKELEKKGRHISNRINGTATVIIRKLQ